ncbi:hypothetical protein OSB04_011290, partial [Centaurea solstitialis]
MKLKNCLYIPALSSKLLSISQVTKELNCVVLMYPTFCILQDILTREIIGRGTERGGLYYVDEVTHQGHAMLAHGTADRQLWLWHRRLGHPSFGYLKMLFPSLFLNKSTCIKCETCVLAKNHRVSFNSSNTRVNSVFSLVHSDVWGPAPNSKKNQFRYFVLFVDDFSRMTWVYFMKHKSEVPDKFFMFYKMIQTQFNKKIQILRSDNGGEFVNQTMQSFIQENGLIHQTSCSNTPQQNGVVERNNRILLEKTRAMMIESQVPKSFWPEAVATSVYLLNRLPTQILGHKTPLKTLESQVTIPSVLTLPPRIFGCSVFTHIPKIHRDKLGPCAEKCVFVGYGPHQMGYRCYNPVSRRIHVTMDCDFLESEFYFDNQPRIQGESIRESLDWLSCSEAVPTEQVDGATESLTINIGGVDEPVYTTSESISKDVQQEMSESQRDSYLHAANDDNSVPETEPDETKPEEPEVRVLPPRKNRGIPPNRFSPEHKKRESKYPIDGDRGRVGEAAKAFSVTLLSENIPRTAQEASEKPEWGEAMSTEMKALEENNTWEKCVLPEGGFLPSNTKLMEQLNGSDKEEITRLQENLFKEFEMKDLGGLKYFLGIEVLRSRERIFISQKKYILDLLVETGMVDCKPVDTPIIVNHNLKINEGAKPANKERYQRLGGKLIYLAHTRPDIAYAVGVVSQFMHQPQKEHMEAVMRIIQYLKGTPGRGIVFKRNGHLNVEAFTDADWASNPNGRRSTSGFFTLLGGNLVTWRSKKQKVVSLSSAESEFRGIVKGVTEILWLKKLMKEIGFPIRLPTRLFCDNEAAISISENPVQHDRTKHVEVDRHFIKEKIEDGTVELPYVKSEEQLADILTKAIPGKVFKSVRASWVLEIPLHNLRGSVEISQNKDNELDIKENDLIVKLVILNIVKGRTVITLPGHVSIPDFFLGSPSPLLDFAGNPLPRRDMTEQDRTVQDRTEQNRTVFGV